MTGGKVIPVSKGGPDAALVSRSGRVAPKANDDAADALSRELVNV